MTGTEYANLIARYVLRNHGEREIRVYREVPFGKTIIGKNRRIDVFVVHEDSGRALAIECKYQDSQGTADEKIPYALADMEASRVPGCIAYAGDGFSQGILHMLEASRLAAYCLPDPERLEPGETTWELDHVLAATFGWWDIVASEKRRFRLE
jgi:hypothetical protein